MRCDSGVGEEAVGDEDGGDGGFSPLAVAVESEAEEGDGGAEDFFLGGFGDEAEEVDCEVEGAEGGEEEVGEFMGFVGVLGGWLGFGPDAGRGGIRPRRMLRGGGGGL